MAGPQPLTSNQSLSSKVLGQVIEAIRAVQMNFIQGSKGPANAMPSPFQALQAASIYNSTRPCKRSHAGANRPPHERFDTRTGRLKPMRSGATASDTTSPSPQIIENSICRPRSNKPAPGACKNSDSNHYPVTAGGTLTCKL